MKILLAWELGGGLGHVSKLLQVARCLRQRKHEVLFAVKNLSTARQLLDEEDFKYLQSPLSLSQKKRHREPASFADILGGAGFSEPDTLGGLVRGWQNLFHIYQPDVLLSQYAPSAQLAGRLDGLPCLRLNTGFECPPEAAPFPCFRPWLRLTKNQLLQREQAILENINKVSVGQGAASHSSLYGALESDLTLLATLPELDHYQERQGGRYSGPLFVVDEGVEIRWSERDSPRVFVYLRPSPGTQTALSALERSGANVIAFIPGIDAKLADDFTGKGFRISTSKVKLSSLLPDMDLAVTHANHGTMAAALLAGVPMLSIPTTIEQLMLSHNLERLGIGLTVRRNKIAEEIAPALERLLTDQTIHKNTKKLSRKYAGYDQNRVAERIANSIERLPEWAKRRQMTRHKNEYLTR